MAGAGAAPNSPNASVWVQLAAAAEGWQLRLLLLAVGAVLLILMVFLGAKRRATNTFYEAVSLKSPKIGGMPRRDSLSDSLPLPAPPSASSAPVSTSPALPSTNAPAIHFPLSPHSNSDSLPPPPLSFSLSAQLIRHRAPTNKLIHQGRLRLFQP